MRKPELHTFSISRFLLVLVTAAALNACSPREADVSASYDVLIIGGQVYDGNNTPSVVSNIGIVGERIVSMNAASDAPADRTLDATGLVVAPGFIDPHTHAGTDLLSDGNNANANYLAQGVTTVFIGSDGGGISDFDNSLDRMKNHGIGSNVAFFVGHGNVRSLAMGLENRAPTQQELARMLELTEEQMRAGAVGLSTGLYYTPGSYSTTEEVVELAKVTARFGGVYDTHMRDESSYSVGLIAAVQEVITIAENTRIPVHISHLKALGRDVWGQSGDVISMVADARGRGLAVTANQYPYQASGTRFSNALIPGWVRADSSEAMFERLANADLADRIREEMEKNLWRRGGAEAMLVTGTDSKWRGMTLADIAAAMQQDSLDAAVEVVRGGDPAIASFVMELPDIHAIAIQDWVMTGSDGSEGHPRKYATYPKVYQDMVVAEKLFPMERFIHRSSGQVADTFNLCDRGYLAEGRQADIVLIDPDNYRPMADFENPAELATGVVHALVNGTMVIADGELSGALPGVVIHRQDIECN